MKIRPDDQWRWYFDPEHSRVMLDLANGMVFRSRFSAKMLTDYAMTLEAVSFSVDDAALFYTFEENARFIPLAPAFKAELALNAVVALRFMKPQMPKSWYFSPFSLIAKPELGQIVQLQLQADAAAALFMAVDVGDNASLCLLAQQKLALNDRVMHFCDPIKVMNDRMALYTKPVQSSLYDRAI